MNISQNTFTRQYLNRSLFLLRQYFKLCQLHFTYVKLIIYHELLYDIKNVKWLDQKNNLTLGYIEYSSHIYLLFKQLYYITVYFLNFKYICFTINVSNSYRKSNPPKEHTILNKIDICYIYIELIILSEFYHADMNHL